MAYWITCLALKIEVMGSNPGHCEVFFSGLLSYSFDHHVTSLSHNACWPVNSSFTSVYGGGKKRINMEKSWQRHLWRQNSEVSAMYGKGALKKEFAVARSVHVLVRHEGFT